MSPLRAKMQRKEDLVDSALDGCDLELVVLLAVAPFAVVMFFCAVKIADNFRPLDFF